MSNSLDLANFIDMDSNGCSFVTPCGWAIFGWVNYAYFRMQQPMTSVWLKPEQE